MKNLAYLSVAVYCFFFGLTSIANNFDGLYSNESGSTLIDIYKDTLIIKSYELDTLAICNLKRVSDTFGELNSIVDPVVKGFKDMSVQRNMLSSDTVDHPAVIRFILPNATEEMEIYVLCGTKSYRGVTNNGFFQLPLDKNITRFPEPLSFDIKPLFYVESNPISQYYGILYLSYPFDIKYNLNELITIELPSVKSNLFYQYYIKGEYVKMNKEGLEWRGEIYYKQ